MLRKLLKRNRRNKPKRRQTKTAVVRLLKSHLDKTSRVLIAVLKGQSRAQISVTGFP